MSRVDRGGRAIVDQATRVPEIAAMRALVVRALFASALLLPTLLPVAQGLAGQSRRAVAVALRPSAPTLPAPVATLSTVSPRYEVTTADGSLAAGTLHRWLLGPHHREAWTTPVAAEILDLSRTAGGLTPLETGGGMQTRSLRFRGADGKEYAFRSVAKDPSSLVDPILRGTVVEDLIKDGISAAHPYGALVAAPLLDAVGVLHARPRLAVMPADPALGPYEAEFAGMLGLFEVRPDENEGGSTAFAGADRVIGSDRLTERLNEGPMDRVDARAYLRARLVDLFLGDFDRHRDQWRWAVLDNSGPRQWVPVPRDRDQVFAHFDGFATRIASLYVPQLVTFGPEYPDPVRLHWNSRAIDRWFLAELDRDVWDAVGRAVRAALTDDVIDAAVAELPPAVLRREGSALASTLKVRRDGLNDAWTGLYELMSRQIDVQATDADDIATILVEHGRATLTLEAPDQLAGPYFVRTFDASETAEVRLHLRGGDDRVIVRGEGDAGMALRVIGGRGDDRFELGGGVTRVHLYDDRGHNEVVGEGPVAIDDRRFDDWEWTPDDRDQPRDWGSRATPIVWASYGSDLGAFIGGGVRRERYGFRQRGFATAVEARAGYAPGIGKGRIEFAGRRNRANSSLFGVVEARYSGIDVLHFYGTGNATVPGGGSLPGGAARKGLPAAAATGARGTTTYHRVDVSRASATVAVGGSPTKRIELTARVGVEHTRTSNRPDRFLATLGSVYGTDAFTALEIGAGITLEPLGETVDTGHRLRFDADAALQPAALDAERAFGRVRASVAGLWAPASRPAVSLAIRGGVEQTFGQTPWHRAAFIGGDETLRGWSDQRFAGDAAVHGGTELRVRVLTPRLVVPGALGVFAFADAGRVFVAGRSPGGWHTGVGGGLFLRPVRQPYMVKLGAAASAEATRVFLTVGLPY